MTKEEFDKKIEGGKLVFVDFFATWCGPCQMMLPIIEELENDYKGKNIVFLKVDIDECPDISNQYGIMSVPTFMLFKDGKDVDSISGAVPKEMLAQKIDNLLK